MESRTTEIDRLESIAKDSWYAKGVNADTIRHSASIFARHWRPGSCLELGPAEGKLSAVLSESFDDLTLVDGSEQFCRDLEKRFPQARVVHSLFEDFTTDRRFDTIVLGHVLEHVDAPAALIRKIRPFLAPSGVLCAAVPNARSLHRQAAVIMGLLHEEHELNETDIHHGHRRVFDPENFRAMFREAGYAIDVFGGYWIKPLSNAQIDETWTMEMKNAFFTLGERYPDIAAEIYVIASAGRG